MKVPLCRYVGVELAAGCGADESANRYRMGKEENNELKEFTTTESFVVARKANLDGIALQNGSGGEEFPPVVVKTEHSYSISGGGGGVSSSNANGSNAACASSSSSSSAAANAASALANNLYFVSGGGNGNGAGSDGDSEPASPLSLEDGELSRRFGPHC